MIQNLLEECNILILSDDTQNLVEFNNVYKTKSRDSTGRVIVSHQNKEIPWSSGDLRVFPREYRSDNSLDLERYGSTDIFYYYKDVFYMYNYPDAWNKFPQTKNQKDKVIQDDLLSVKHIPIHGSFVIMRIPKNIYNDSEFEKRMKIKNYISNTLLMSSVMEKPMVIFIISDINTNLILPLLGLDYLPHDPQSPIEFYVSTIEKLGPNLDKTFNQLLFKTKRYFSMELSKSDTLLTKEMYNS